MSIPLAQFHWSENTIQHFRFVSSYLTKEQTIEKIVNFIEFDCTPVGNETESDLINDLIKQIYYKS
jgi:hypothetical protein